MKYNNIILITKLIKPVNRTIHRDVTLRRHDNVQNPKRSFACPSGGLGSGVGKGGGAGGTIRESGGGLGEYGAAQEEAYFYNKQREQLEKLKQKLKNEPAKPAGVSQKEEK